MKSKLAEMFLHLDFVLRDHHFVGAQPQSVFRFVRRRRKQHDVGAEGMGEFDPHVAEAAETHDANFLTFLHLPVAQRRVGGDARAEQRSGRCEIELFGYLQRKSLGDHDALGVAAVGDASDLLVFGVVGESRHVVAILLFARAAAGAHATGIDHAAHRCNVALFELLDGAAGFDHAADDFVPGTQG